MNPKKVAGERAAELVEDGMVVGLGTGSTAYYVVKRLGERVADGLNIIGIPTSIQTENLAKECGITLSTVDEHGDIDLTIDGADEIDPELNLIKGLGGALVREKIVASASKRLVIIADETKIVPKLGTKSPLPVEITQFASRNMESRLQKLCDRTVLREKDGKVFVTDNENYIVDCYFDDGIKDPVALEIALNMIPGVLESGLFIGMAEKAIIGSDSGVRTFLPKRE